MARRIGREYERAQPKIVFRNLLDLSAKVEIEAARVTVTIDKRAHNPYLVAAGLADDPRKCRGSAISNSLSGSPEPYAKWRSVRSR